MLNAKYAAGDCYCLPCSVPSLLCSGADALRLGRVGQVDRERMQAAHMVLCPWNVSGCHWLLLLVNFKTKVVSIGDSLQPRGMQQQLRREEAVSQLMLKG